MTLPNLTVLLDDGSGSFPFDISSKVLAVDGYEITRGRDDWQGAVTAGELSLALNNSDGRFTPGSTILGTPSPITLDQRIRVKETINGVTYTRFTGYAKAWPVAWPATVPTFATVQLSATDAQARAERWTLRSMYEEEVLLDSPQFYYTLGEASDSTTAGDSSGLGQPPLTQAGSGSAVTFGGTAAVGEITTAQFNGGQYLTIDIPAGFTLAAVEFWAATTSASDMALFGATAGGIARQPLEQSTNYVRISGGGGIAATNWTHDGAFHHIVWIPGTGLYCDDVLFSNASTIGGTVTRLVFGGSQTNGGLPAWTGWIGQVVVYTTAPSGARIATHYNVGKDTAAETTSARITRLASYAPLPLGTLDSGLTTVPSQSTAGSSLFDALQEVADAEMGLVFVDGFGNLTFHNRNRVVSKTVPDLTLDSQWITPDVSPVVDDQRLVNYAEITASGTGATSLATSATSETTHGRYPQTETYTLQTDAEAQDRASWIVSTFAEPSPRYGTLTINLFKMTPAQASAVLAALDLDCWLRVTSMASQNPGGTVADVVVQGWQETVNAETWTIQCNVVGRAVYSPVWILGTSHLGTDTRLYV